MSSRSWVCFACRKGVRREATYREHTAQAARVPCSDCGAPCTFVGHKLELPPRRDERAWQALRARAQAEAIEREERERLERFEARRALGARIAELEAKSPNKDRARRIDQLREQLEREG